MIQKVYRECGGQRMRTNLYFVSHAHSIYTEDELRRPLSERGVQDALMITEKLKGLGIDHVISSPYKRAVQTVNEISSFIGKEIEIVNDFRERKLSSHPVDNFPTAIRKVWEDENFSWEGGESNLAARKRGADVVSDVLTRHEGRNIVIGTHGNIMVLIMNHYDRKYDFHFWQQLQMPDVYCLSFEEFQLVEVERVF